jgi:hypothetical protein
LIERYLDCAIAGGNTLAGQAPATLTRAWRKTGRVGPLLIRLAFQQLKLTRATSAGVAFIGKANATAQCAAQHRIARLAAEHCVFGARNLYGKTRHQMKPTTCTGPQCKWRALFVRVTCQRRKAARPQSIISIFYLYIVNRLKYHLSIVLPNPHPDWRQGMGKCDGKLIPQGASWGSILLHHILGPWFQRYTETVQHR